MQGKKRFSSKVMEFTVKVGVSEGIWKQLVKRQKETGDSHAGYLRSLIKKDLNIDDYGKETNSR